MITVKMFGYKDIADYYQDAQCGNYLHRVKIPLFLLSAEDDPVAHHSIFPYAKCEDNKYTIFGVTKSGGHIDWFESLGYA